MLKMGITAVSARPRFGFEFAQVLVLELEPEHLLGSGVSYKFVQPQPEFDGFVLIRVK